MMERPVFWYQGLFLQPQHFQLGDLHFQSLLTPFNKFLQPHFWGVESLEIQASSLANHSFNLLKGKFLFPDMTYVVLPDNAVVKPRNFENAWVDGGKPFTVYAGLRKFSRTNENVAVVANTDDISEVTNRFVTTTATEDAADLYQSGPVAHVKRLNYIVKIFWENEVDQLGDYAIIPIARLERTGEEILISEKFAPPCITVKSTLPILKIVREIMDQISSRCFQLESYKKERGIHSAEFGARDMVYLLALRSLNRYIPKLIHSMETGDIHPWKLYEVLRQLIGELSSFSGNVNVKGETFDGTHLLPAYQHKKLWDCFSAAQKLITTLLEEITAGPEYVFELLFDGTYFTNELPPAVFDGGNRFYLVLETDENQQTVLSSIETVAKLSSRESLPILIARALSGVRLEHLKTPPQELPRRANSIYFQIDAHSEQWVNIQQGHNIALYWDEAPANLKVELMVVGKS